jgi:hypothetical protein
MPIAVPGAGTARRERLIWEVLERTTPSLLAGIVLKVSLMILLTPTADQVQVAGIARIVGKEDGGLTEQIIPELRVEFQIAEMVGVFEKATDRGEKIDHLPELVRQLEILQQGGRGKSHPFPQQQIEEDNRLCRLKFDNSTPEVLFQFRREVGGLSPQHGSTAEGSRLATKSFNPLSLFERAQRDGRVEGRGSPLDDLGMETGRIALVRQMRCLVSARRVPVE